MEQAGPVRIRVDEDAAFLRRFFRQGGCRDPDEPRGVREIVLGVPYENWHVVNFSCNDRDEGSRVRGLFCLQRTRCIAARMDNGHTPFFYRIAALLVGLGMGVDDTDFF